MTGTINGIATAADLPLTDSERLDVLMDAVTLYEVRRRHVERTSHALTLRDVPDETWSIVMNGPLDAELDAQEALVERVCALMADGLLERCAFLLKVSGAETP